ncbi:internalin N-terminal domain-containing protein [Enterococcus quebecensis]|uniref:Internalin N-terminal domain-containing protein n=1 Tax=Enterococcus quebecensis TaxID=903983 RepID=A0A1E5GQ73_9ENTE|nr:internalin N-terminal domain-containing protein [Enterococcus quebecensis]OEG14843.1 hypothetical protein BCR23_12160 [Enterococcus quebecensis]OJG73947.1 hypothetical protein RV12_GL000528 [Enterococcus quebecensis]
MIKKNVYLSLVFAVVAVFTFVGFGESAEAYVYLDKPTKVNEVFPDPAFAGYMAKQLKKNPNDLVTQAELDNITYVNISGMGVKSIEGIKYMHYNWAFHFFGNEVESIEPFRDWENHKLNNLQFYYNPISDISPLLGTKLPNLWILHIHFLNLDNSAFDVLTKFDTSMRLATLALKGNHMDDFHKLTKLPFRGSLWANLRYQDQEIKREPVTVGKQPLVIENTSTDNLPVIKKMPITNANGGVQNGDLSVSWNEEEIDYGTESLVMNVESATTSTANYNKPTVEYTLPLKWQPLMLGCDSVVRIGAKFDPLSNASAYDAEDGDISDKVIVKESTVPVDENGIATKKGTYKVVFYVVDSDGNDGEQTVKVRVF